MVFTDFSGTIGQVRTKMGIAVDNLMAETSGMLNVEDSDLRISWSDGELDVQTIALDTTGEVPLTYVKTHSGKAIDFMELSTDDMVAIYEHIWYRVKEK